MIDLTLWRIKRKVKRHFKFLYDAGFRIYSSKYQPEHMGYWEINFYSKDLLVQIYSDRGEIMMNIDSSRDEHTWHGLGTVVFFITEEKEFIGNYEGSLLDLDSQLHRLAEIFQKHFEKIRFMFGDSYEDHLEGLSKAHDTFLGLTVEDYRKSRPKEDFMKYVPNHKQAG